MSGAMMRQRRATYGNNIPAAYSPVFTGVTKQMYSPKAKRVVTYRESYTIRVTQSSATPPDVNTLMANLNSQVSAQNVDAQCDEILLVQGAVSDQYKFRTWIAEEQVVPAGTLVAGWVYAACVVWIAITAVVLAVVILCYTAFMSIADALMPGKPTYVGGADPTNPTTFNDWAAYLSSQNQLYWYVCPKCGAGFGLKSSYPSIDSVPTTEKQAFEEHKNECLGIPQTNYNIAYLLIWGIVGVAAVAFVVYVLPKIIRSARK